MDGIYNDGAANVVGVGFADKLKIHAARSLGRLDLNDQECIDLMDEFKEDGFVVSAGATAGTITGRQYLQNVGNEARKLFGDTFWIDMVLPNVVLLEGWGEKPEQAHGALTARYPGVDCLCITDLRYPNEAERIKRLGGVVWEVVRPGTGSDGHASEQPLPRHLVDHVIDNSGDLYALEREVERALDTLT